MLFQGSMAAIVTPFSDGRVDEESLSRHIEWQIAGGTDVIVPCGTTGEAATLTYEERERVVRIAVEVASGRVPVLAGAGSNSTAEAIRLAKQAKAAGADGTLQVTPYYNKPTQEGLYRHFLAVAQVVDLPMVLYNVPGRTGVNMLPETVLRLAAIDHIVGIKEASGDIEQIRGITQEAPEGLAVLSGDDAMNLEIYRAGGRGCISVTANVAPDRVAKVWDRFKDGDIDTASRLQRSLEPLNRAMFIETNPIPVKTALAIMGRINEEFRLPLTPMSDEHRAHLLSVLRQTGLVE
jgi:4-hydroxy-tetrahydrodipicolinate synthase